MSCQTSLEFSGGSVPGGQGASSPWGLLRTLPRFSLAVAQRRAGSFLTHWDVGWTQKVWKRLTLEQSWDLPGPALLQSLSADVTLHKIVWLSQALKTCPVLESRVTVNGSSSMGVWV